MGLAPGEVIAGTSYQVVRQIGAGGMGIVYEVEHVRLRKRYVAKVIHEQIRGDADAPKRMEREAQVLAEINHPNVVQVHDVGVTPNGISYFVMERLDGQDLRGAMKEGTISPARAVSICVDILDALDHVHRRGIVHRDIKPENIFIAQMPTGAVTKVLDFGVVHIFDADHASQARITKTGGFVGTLYYAAPELLKGEVAGPPIDVYATGLVLYELLLGRGPFDDDKGVGLSRCFKPAPPLPTNERITSALAAAVAASLEQDPTARPTAGELATRLRQTLPSLATDPGPAANPRKTVENLLAGMTPHTAAPATPLMAGAPARAHAVTVASPNVTPGPNVDTSSGVASSIEPFAGKPRAPLALLIGAPIAALVVFGLIATAGITALRRSPPTNAAAAVSMPPPPEVPPATAEPAPEPAAEPVAPALSATATASAPASGSAVKPAPAARPAGKPRGNAEKDGYMKDL